MNQARYIVAVSLSMFFTALCPNVLADNTVNINILYSHQWMDKWSQEISDSTSTAFGVEGDFAPSDWPINLLLGVSSGKFTRISHGYSGDTPYIPMYSDGYTISGDTSHVEIYAGIRKYFQVGGRIGSHVSPYISAAVATVRTEVGGTVKREANGNMSNVSSGASANSTGYILSSGIIFKFLHFHMGFDIRQLSGAKPDLPDPIANYFQLGAVLGFDF